MSQASPAPRSSHLSRRSHLPQTLPLSGSSPLSWLSPPPVLKLLFVAMAFMCAFAFGLPAVPASAEDVPYAKLGDVLGTPKLAFSLGPKDKSQLLLKFVRDGEDEQDWTKMTTVSILKVPQKDTEAAGRGVIAKLRDELKTRHAQIDAFNESEADLPATCYFAFTADGEIEKGVVYSPAPGFVTVAQVGAKSAHVIATRDILVLKGLLAHR